MPGGSGGWGGVEEVPTRTARPDPKRTIEAAFGAAPSSGYRAARLSPHRGPGRCRAAPAVATGRRCGRWARYSWRTHRNHPTRDVQRSGRRRRPLAVDLGAFAAGVPSHRRRVLPCHVPAADVLHSLSLSPSAAAAALSAAPSPSPSRPPPPAASLPRRARCCPRHLPPTPHYRRQSATRELPHAPYWQRHPRASFAAPPSSSLSPPASLSTRVPPRLPRPARADAPHPPSPPALRASRLDTAPAR